MRHSLKNLFFCAIITSFTPYNQFPLHAASTLTTPKKIFISIATIITAAIIGKSLHALYCSYKYAHKNIINHCHQAYKEIHLTMEKNTHLYVNDAQLSDWDLKAMIYAQKNDHQYPFMAYYSSLSQALYATKKDINTINTELKNLAYYKGQISTYGTANSAETIEMFTHLEHQGTVLITSLNKIKSLIHILKNRIILFKEYNDDYHNWIYEQN